MYTGMPMLLHAWLLACRCVVNRLALHLASRVLHRSETSYAPEAGGAVTAAGKPCWINRMRSEFRAHQLLFRCEEVPSPHRGRVSWLPGVVCLLVSCFLSILSGVVAVPWGRKATERFPWQLASKSPSAEQLCPSLLAG